ILLLALPAVVSAQALQINPATLSGGVVGASYPIQILGATGGTSPYGSTTAPVGPNSNCSVPTSASRWCVAGGSFPAGLTLSTTGSIGGTPTTATGGPSIFVVRLT